ncbi:MAG: OmpA family protein, partial [Saprospiraceae bacterium]|nr:OmpA family protein [Saprospiraceae bacterium]
AHLPTENINSFEDQVNTDDNEGTISFNQDRTQMSFCRCFNRGEYDSHCKLMISSKREGHWTKPEILPFVQDGINYRHPAFTVDGQGLLFSANIEDATNGYDLYVVYLDEEEEWGDPLPLSSRLNSEYDELFPFMHDDTLYYSSNMGGMGGLDVYRSHPLPNGSWSPPMNMMAPINSGADDFGFVINPYFEETDSVLQVGFFSSSRAGGMGSDDIYQFKKNKYHLEPPAEPEAEFEYEIVLDLRIFQKEYEDPDDPNSTVIMRVPLSEAKISATENGASFRETASDKYGMLTLQLDPDKKYDFFVSHDGFFNNQASFSTEDLLIDSTTKIQRYEERILLDKIFFDKEVVLENIYYDLDEDFIREDAQPTLNELADLLKINPQIKIQLSSHTDCRAGDDYNIDLSQRRAESAIQFLIEIGINAERLSAKGYGETLLAVACECEDCTEEEHQANRRTTFKVIE